MKKVYFVGTIVLAEQVDWDKLDEINDEADNFLQYMGNYPVIDEGAVCALFKDRDTAKCYCLIPSEQESFT